VTAIEREGNSQRHNLEGITYQQLASSNEAKPANAVLLEGGKLMDLLRFV
jgi:hypothetical protein